MGRQYCAWLRSFGVISRFQGSLTVSSDTSVRPLGSFNLSLKSKPASSLSDSSSYDALFAVEILAAVDFYLLSGQSEEFRWRSGEISLKWRS